MSIESPKERAPSGSQFDGPARLHGRERPGIRPSLQHNALHMAKYAGELAMIAEDADHDDPRKHARAKQRARDWLKDGERERNLRDHFEAILEDLRDLATEGEPVGLC